LYNVSRQQGDVRLFEIGHVFDLPDNGAVRDVPFPLPVERESLGVLLAWPDDGADTAVRIWRTIQEAFHIEGVVLKNGQVSSLHPSRGATLMTHAEEELGVVGEIDSTILKSFGLVDSSRNVGWLTLDVEMLLGSLRQTNFVSRSISRFPSHDIDLAFVVPDEVPASAVKSTLVEAAGELLESIDLFDVYKREDNIDSGSRSSKPEYFFDNYSGVQPTGNPKDNIDSGSRSLAWHLRFRAIDRTLTDEDIEGLIKGCIEKVFKSHSARLRG
jgi:phenylalanyl-tRNA synthetase beta chain